MGRRRRGAHRGEGARGGPGLLLQPGDDRVRGPAWRGFLIYWRSRKYSWEILRNPEELAPTSVILRVLAVLEELEGWVALHLELLGDFGVLRGVQLPQQHGRALLREGGGRLGVLGGQGLGGGG